ncbi:MAG: lectin [Acidobacteriota bacterium]
MQSKRLGFLATMTVGMSAFVIAQQPPPAAPAGQPPAPAQPMSFFATSVNPGDGANLGGLAGADAHCQKLATAAGAGSKTWHAYLSASASGGQAAVNARDRIGPGPWYNGRGAKIAQSVADLHGDTLDAARLGNNLSRTTVVTEKNEAIKGAGDTPNQHDMLTGSKLDGTAYTDAADHTCGNWTSNSTGTAQLGHFDRTGGGNTSWNSAHPSRGCSPPNLVATGGAGLFYCFATN